MINEQRNVKSSGVDYNNVFLLILDIIVLHIKFWYAILEAIIKSFLPAEKRSVSGQVVLVTGAGHGIGRETALKYGSLGAKVVVWDINEKGNEETKELIKKAGGEAFAYTCNVMNRDEINAVAQTVQQKHGFVNVVVNNAGIMPCHPLIQTSEAEIRNMFGINVLAHFWIIQAFLPAMIERNEGHFVALSSCAGLFGLPNLVPYCGTKFAVRGLMQSLAEELRFQNPHNNIKLTTIYPYMVDTGLCKKPRYRFPSLFTPVKPETAAAVIVSAQRRGEEDVSIPRHYIVLEKITRLFPKKANRLLNDFIDTGVDSDL